MIFIDTSAFLARYLSRDQHLSESIAGWKMLAHDPRTCFTSNFVLDELFTVLGRRADYSFAAERARSIYASTTLQILRPDRNDEIGAIALMARYADQRVSFTDCISFQLMRTRRIQLFFGFDRHFELVGFERWTPSSGTIESLLSSRRPTAKTKDLHPSHALSGESMIPGTPFDRRHPVTAAQRRAVPKR